MGRIRHDVMARGAAHSVGAALVRDRHRRIGLDRNELGLAELAIRWVANKPIVPVSPPLWEGPAPVVAAAAPVPFDTEAP
jgi:hypothetical protein